MNSEPVTAIISRKVAVHLQTEFEAWQADISYAASQFPGYQGVTVLRPASPQQLEYVVILRFDSYANLANWETSDTRQEFLHRGDKLFGSRISVQRYIGMALWFAPPSVPQPPRYKMVLLLTCTIFTLSLVTAPLFDRLLRLLPPPLQQLGAIAIQVSLITYLILPWLTQRLSPWLYSTSFLAPLTSKLSR